MPEPRKPTLALSLLGLPLLARAGAVCSDLIVSVDARAEVNATVVPPKDLTDPNLLTDLLNTITGAAGQLWPLVPVEGTYDLSATYCEPEGSVADTVQLLCHGATYDKTYWTGHGLDSDKDIHTYSWAHYSADEGYATLSIDRLGQGNSADADPLLEVQVNLEAEIAAVLAQKLRDGKIVAKTDYGEIGGTKFENVVYVGHSLGSLIGSVAARRDPGAFDGYVLTGWSVQLIQHMVKVVAGTLASASIFNPSKWGDLHPGYLVFTNEPVMRENFFADEGTFDPEIRARDWERRNTVSLTEMLTVFSGMNPAVNYTGPVQVLIGEYDTILCNKGPRCVPGENNTPGNAADIFPASNNYNYSITEGAGHNLNLHNSARDSYKAAHEFIRDNVG